MGSRRDRRLTRPGPAPPGHRCLCLVHTGPAHSTQSTRLAPFISALETYIRTCAHNRKLGPANVATCGKLTGLFANADRTDWEKGLDRKKTKIPAYQTIQLSYVSRLYQYLWSGRRSGLSWWSEDVLMARRWPGPAPAAIWYNYHFYRQIDDSHQWQKDIQSHCQWSELNAHHTTKPPALAIQLYIDVCCCCILQHHLYNTRNPRTFQAEPLPELFSIRHKKKYLLLIQIITSAGFQMVLISLKPAVELAATATSKHSRLHMYSAVLKYCGVDSSIYCQHSVRRLLQIVTRWKNVRWFCYPMHWINSLRQVWLTLLIAIFVK